MPQNNQIVDAIKQICDEKNIAYDSVIETIEQALAAAYRKDFGQKNQNIKCEFRPETGQVKAFDMKTVVEDLPPEEEPGLEEEQTDGEKKDREIKKPVQPEAGPRQRRAQQLSAGNKEIKKEKDNVQKGEIVETDKEERKFNPRTEIQISDAKKIKKTAKVNDIIKTALEIPTEFGRMAAQTAKQVIIQRLREVERDTIFKEYKNKEGQVLMGVVQRMEGRTALVDLGNATALLLPEQQAEAEKYNSGERYRFYILQVREAPKGPEIILSRTHPEIIKQLFALEVPEISSGTVEIKAISREAGSRSKIAVYTSQSNIDPIGSCVGQRGTRIQTIINELGGEKVDIIEYDDDPVKFIANALAPAKVASVEIKDKENRLALIKVKPEQLSLAIGKGGQNVRLAAKLTGWKMDIAEIGKAGEKAQADEDREKIEKLGQPLAGNEEIKDKDDGGETKKQEIKKQGDKEGAKKDACGKEKPDEDKDDGGKENLDEDKVNKLDKAGKDKKKDKKEKKDKNTVGADGGQSAK